MTNFLAPIKRKDHRTYDFHRTFGSAVVGFLDEFNFDHIGMFPDQNSDGLPFACTAYTHSDMAGNEDGSYYDDYRYLYEKNKFMLGVQGNVPINQINALKAATVYGVKRKEDDEEEAFKNRRAPYFIVKKNPDYYDGLISAMLVKQGTLSIGTPWLPEFYRIGSDGLIPPFVAPKSFSLGHCWEACGQKIINGTPYIISKSWQGKNFGDNGYCYFNREQINSLLATPGSGAFGQKKAGPEDIQRVKMSIIETLLSYLANLLEKTMSQDFSKPALLDSMCAAIRDYEGKPGDRNYRNNNPGNAKFSPVGYATIYGEVKKDKDGFAIFKDYETGWRYLKNLILSKARKNPEHTLVDFFKIYAPAEDSNDPNKYAEYVAKRMAVDVNIFKIGSLL